MKLIRRWIILVSLSVAAAWVLRSYGFETVSVASASMEPTLYVGTHYLVNRWIYRVHPPQRGDIIVFTSPVDEQTGYIKRVIAVPGDKIELRNKQVVLNETPLAEPYTIYKRSGERLVGDNIGPLTVPEDHLFVLGDNRDESFDSSVWKDTKTDAPIYFLPFANIKGRLIQVP